MELIVLIWPLIALVFMVLAGIIIGRTFRKFKEGVKKDEPGPLRPGDSSR